MITALEIKNNVSDWRPILSSFGLPELRVKESSCIFCGGKTRARWIPEKQYYFCNQCDKRSRDGIELIKDYNSWDFITTINELAEHLGIKEAKKTSHQMKKIKLINDKNRYMKSMQYFQLSLTHKNKLSNSEENNLDDAINTIRRFRTEHVNYIELCSL